jgi:hypothetical protein
MNPSLPVRPVAALFLAAVTVLAVLVPVAPADAAIDSVAETRFVDSVNAERAQRGLARLRVATDLRDVARRHSVRMADTKSLYHNPNLRTDVTGWQRLAENVGRGPSVASLHSALMASTGHRANILDGAVTEIGIGVEVRGSTVWVTQVFRQPTTETTIRFGDVSGSQTHARSIARIASSAVTLGCTSSRYCPDREVSRAEMATFLARSRALLPKNSTTFRDAQHTPVHSSNIQAIADQGITAGCGGDRYCPTDSVTRAEMATFLMRALGLKPVAGSTFADVDPRSTHAGAINAIAEAGITSGCGTGRYCPDRPLTRAEMATFLTRAFRL